MKILEYIINSGIRNQLVETLSFTEVLEDYEEGESPEDRFTKLSTEKLLEITKNLDSDITYFENGVRGGTIDVDDYIILECLKEEREEIIFILNDRNK